MHFKVKTVFLYLNLFLAAQLSQAQQKLKITVEDIWAKPTLAAKSVYGVNWMKDSHFYTSQVPDNANKVSDIVKVDVNTGQPVSTIIEGESLKADASQAPIQYDGYEFSADEKKVLFSTETEPIYRRSSKAEYYVYDLDSKKLTKLSNGEIGRASCRERV